MKTKIISFGIFMFLGVFYSFGQDTIIFTPGSGQTWTVPGCVSGGIELTMGGASGGGPNGGDGALLTGTIPVNPGDVIDIVVGGAGGCPGAGTNGGGNGFASTDGNVGYNSCGGGGLTQIMINGTLYAVAGAGGGSGGGSTTNNAGGDGGCATGVSGGNTFGAGGTGGTQTAPGTGGTPWAGTPPGGSNGVGQQGGDGGFWQTASGGGGGAGFFGGGGGGNDGCCTGANGGGGGGGGSSLVPPALGCVQGGNTGPGEIMIVIPVCETTICSGDTAFIDFAPQFPAGATDFTVTPPIGVYQATVGDPYIGFHPVDSILYTVTAIVAGAPVDISWPVHAVDPIFPDAGLDDSLCHSTTSGAQLNGTLDNGGNFNWTVGNITTFSGGAGNSLFVPGPGNISPTVLGNLPGHYTYILHEEDTTGVCPEGTDTVMIYFSEETHTTTVTEISCFEAADGSIIVDSDATPASGDLGANQYSIDGGTTYQTSNVFNNLSGGTYDIISMDYLGCMYDTQVILDEPDEIVLSLVSSDTTLCQNGTATMAVSATGVPIGGTYTYNWTATTATTSTVSVTPSPAGTDFSTEVYAVTDLGCYSDTLSLNVDHHDPIVISITPNDSICPGEDASHTVTVSGGFLDGAADYNYAWTANGTGMANNSSTIDISPVQTTDYCVTVSDVCETTPQTLCSEVVMNTVPQASFTSDKTWGCDPSTIVFTNTTTPAGITESVTWIINDVTYTDENSFSVNFTDVGTYDVWMGVYSEHGCYDEIFVADYITIYDKPSPDFTVNPNTTTVYFPEVQLNNLTQGDNLIYQWDIPGGSPETSNQESPGVVYPEVAATYPIQLTVTNEWGCVDSANTYLNITNDIFVYAPNIFTPDGDEYNEAWKIYITGIDIYDFHLMIFNRWGEPVWESFNSDAAWNGTYGNNGIVEDGTYIWVIDCKDKFNDKRYEFRGHVTVLK